MATLTIELSDEARVLAETRAREAGHATLQAYVEALIQSDSVTDHGAPADLHGGSAERIIELLDDAEATPFTEMTQREWDDLRTKVITSRGAAGV